MIDHTNVYLEKIAELSEREHNLLRKGPPGSGYVSGILGGGGTAALVAERLGGKHTTSAALLGGLVGGTVLGARGVAKGKQYQEDYRNAIINNPEFRQKIVDSNEAKIHVATLMNDAHKEIRNKVRQG